MTVEDSGPGIPLEKRSQLFERFQESLDELKQGTGIGLNLSASLVRLMEGTLFLDESYRSDVQGCPGARFVIDLPKIASVQPSLRPIDEFSEHSVVVIEDVEVGKTTDEVKQENTTICIPADIRVLLVDDDTILRKMLSRSLKRVAPTWKVREAANGETALSIVQDEVFDLIFVDQYMASGKC